MAPPQPTPSVVVVGSFIQDLTWRCRHFPAAGETVLGEFATGPGGKGSNQAVAAARAGARTRFIGAIGNDAFAAGARAFHAAEGISSHFVPRSSHPTGTAGILVNAEGQNEIIVALGASARLRPADIPASLLRGARVVVCQHESTLAVNAHVFRLARRLGATTVLNPAPMRPDFDHRILAATDILIPNESEFAALTGGSPAARLAPEALHRLARTLPVPVVIITLAERGCLVSQADGYTHLPACTGVRVIDTTGAGDAFVGAFAAGRVRSSKDLLAAARFANVAAALSVTRAGTAPSMPRRAEIQRLLRRMLRSTPITPPVPLPGERPPPPKTPPMSSFSQINYLHVLVVAIIGFLIGWIWYSALFGKIWRVEMKIADEQIAAAKPKMAGMMARGFIHTLLSTFGLALLLVILRAPDVTYAIKVGLLVGVLLVGVRLCNIALWEGKSMKLVAINVGHETVMFIVQAIVLTAWR